MENDRYRETSGESEDNLKTKSTDEETQGGKPLADDAKATTAEKTSEAGKSKEVILKPAKRENFAYFLVRLVADAIALFAYRSSDRGTVYEAAVKLMATLMAINELDEYATTIQVEGVPVPLSDYEIWTAFEAFVLPRKVSLTNDEEEQDLAMHKMYGLQGIGILDAENFKKTQAEMIRKMVRFQASFEALNRNVQNASDAYKWAASKAGVRNVNQERVIALKGGLLYDDTFKISMQRWVDSWIARSTTVNG